MSTTHLVRAPRGHRYAGLSILITQVQDVSLSRGTYARAPLTDWRQIVPWSAVPQVAQQAERDQVSWRQAAATWLQTTHGGA
jgi:hypothetical protein